jgi:hypothetical protein
MRSILLATCIAFATASTVIVTPVRAEVSVSVPGIDVEAGRDHHVDRHDSMRHEDVETDRSKSISHDGDRTTIRKSNETTVR